MAVVDKGFANVAALDYADIEQVALYTPAKEVTVSPATKSEEFCRINSTWNVENKRMTCPVGRTFSIYRDTRGSPHVPEFMFVRRPHVCSACPLDGQCFPDAATKKKPIIRFRKRTEDLWLNLKGRMQTAAGKKLYRLRSQCELQNAKSKLSCVWTASTFRDCEKHGRNRNSPQWPTISCAGLHSVRSLRLDSSGLCLRTARR